MFKRSEVASLLNLDECIEAVEEAFPSAAAACRGVFS
jgi:hypothetical protein